MSDKLHSAPPFPHHRVEGHRWFRWAVIAGSLLGVPAALVGVVVGIRSLIRNDTPSPPEPGVRLSVSDGRVAGGDVPYPIRRITFRNETDQTATIEGMDFAILAEEPLTVQRVVQRVRNPKDRLAVEVHPVNGTTKPTTDPLRREWGTDSIPPGGTLMLDFLFCESSRAGDLPDTIWVTPLAKRYRLKLRFHFTGGQTAVTPEIIVPAD